jgi:hypothetical protein
LREDDQLLPLYRRARSSHSIQELNCPVGTRCDRKEFRNPCSDQPAFVDVQSFAVHILRASLGCEHQLVDE